MMGQPDEYRMTVLEVRGENWLNLYWITPEEQLQSVGDRTVQVHKGVNIDYIGFFGTKGLVPDSGSTLLLFGLVWALGIAATFAPRRSRARA